jgi:hypothetical protein
LIETMEVQGVVYVRVNNPTAVEDSTAEPTLWVPVSVYQGGKYVATAVNLPKSQKDATATTVASAPVATANQKDANATNSASSSELPAEEQLSAATPTILPLRRRVLLFPTRVTQIRPEIATLLCLELETTLPLRVQEPQNVALREKGRLMNQPAEITGAVQNWLKNHGIPSPVQFVIFLTTSSGHNYQFYTCTWIDAQTGDNVAAFTFRADLNGQLILPLVPNHPTPLLRLIDSTSWWCKIKSRPDDQLYVLEAGHRSNLNYGRELQVFTKAAEVYDPQTKKHLGFRFQKPLGSISVIDFFAADGSLGLARTPLATNFTEAWAVETASPDMEQVDLNDQNLEKEQ